MSCLTDYIGLQLCNEDAPESGLYINSLPGISIESMDKIAESEQVTFKGVWTDVQDVAWTRFYLDFITELNKCFELNPYCDYASLICNQKEKIANAWMYLLGNQLMIFRIYSPRINQFTTIDRDQAKELKDFYQVEYEKNLSIAAKLIDVSDCECMQCGGNPQFVTWLP